jgi:hypothetical protein
LGIGGADSRENLWPESRDTQPWNAGVKDRLENYLHVEVCAEHIAVAQAQKEIATDWVAAYRKYLGVPQGYWGKGEVKTKEQMGEAPIRKTKTPAAVARSLMRPHHVVSRAAVTATARGSEPRSRRRAARAALRYFDGQ